MREFLNLFKKREDKRVEFIELVYDLMFVYIVRRYNPILHEMTGDFFSLDTFLLFLLATITAIQIWYFSTLYINRYGENSVRDYVFLLSNMYLLYFMVDGLGAEGDANYVQFCVSWAMILLNISLQYIMQLRRNTKPLEVLPLRAHYISLIVQASIILISIPIEHYTGSAIAWVSLIAGVIAIIVGEQLDFVIPLNSEHITERIMLYMVFTFGETIISISEYFVEGFNLVTIYYSLMAFLIVAGLLLTYGLLYNRIIDRERYNIGIIYMVIHAALIISLNCITVGLEFMTMSEVGLEKKSAFLAFSFVCYYIITYFLGFYAKRKYRAGMSLYSRLILISAAYLVLAYAFYQSPAIAIAFSVIYVYSMFFMVAVRMIAVQKRRQEELKKVIHERVHEQVKDVAGNILSEYISNTEAGDEAYETETAEEQDQQERPPYGLSCQG